MLCLWFNNWSTSFCVGNCCVTFGSTRAQFAYVDFVTFVSHSWFPQRTARVHENPHKTTQFTEQGNVRTHRVSRGNRNALANPYRFLCILLYRGNVLSLIPSDPEAPEMINIQVVKDFLINPAYVVF